MKLKKYKGYKIRYVKEEFRAYDNNKPIFSEITEKRLREKIDKNLLLIKQAAKEEKEAKERASKYSDLTSQKFLFDIKSLLQTVRSVSEICTEVRFTLEKGDLTIIQMDPANVAMIKTSCPYTGSKGPIEAMINATSLSRVLGNSFSKFDCEEVTISFTPGEKDDDLVMNLSNEQNSLSMHAYKPDSDRAKIPKLEFLSTHTMSKKDLSRAIMACDEMGESVWFENENNKLSLVIKGDNGEYRAKSINEGKGKDCKAKYSIEYLKKAVCGSKCQLTGTEISINFSQDYPLKLIDEYEDAFILAPRVDSSD